MRRVVLYLAWIGAALVAVSVTAELFAWSVHYPSILGVRWLGLFYTLYDWIFWNASLKVNGPQMFFAWAGLAAYLTIQTIFFGWLYSQVIGKPGNTHGTSRRLSNFELWLQRGFVMGPIPLGLSDTAKYKERLRINRGRETVSSKRFQQELPPSRRTTVDTVYKLKRKGKLIYSSENTHFMGIASTRSGKGISLVIPTLKTYPHSVVVYDIKKENWEQTAAHRSAFSNPVRYEPASPDTPRWNPLLEIHPGPRTISDAIMLGEILASLETEEKDADYWALSSSRTITAYILYTLQHPRITSKSLYTIYSLLTSNDREAVFLEMACFPEDGLSKDERQVVDYFKKVANTLLQMGHNELSGVMGTCVAKLQLFVDPTVRRATEKSDWTIESLVHETRPTSLYIITSPGDAPRLRPLVRILLLFIGQKLTIGSSEETKLRHPLLMLIDEFPSLGKMSFFETQIGYFAGYNIKLMLIIQSFNQLYRIYGERTAIPDNCKIKVILGVDSYKEAKEVSDYLGVTTVQRESHSRNTNAQEMFEGSVGKSLSEGARQLLTPDEVMRLKFDELILLRPRSFPYFGKKIMYYMDPRFRTDPRLICPDTPQAQLVHLIRTENPWSHVLDRAYIFDPQEDETLPQYIREKIAKRWNSRIRANAPIERVDISSMPEKMSDGGADEDSEEIDETIRDMIGGGEL